MRAALLVGIAGVAAQALALGAAAAPAAGPAPPAGAWKQVFETNQTVYYVGAASAAPGAEHDIATLLEFKVPQVVDGAQAWSMVSRMKVNCDAGQVMTVENIVYALPMGAGPAVQTQASDDAWHQPDPGSLGELVLDTGCGRS